MTKRLSRSTDDSHIDAASDILTIAGVNMLVQAADPALRRVIRTQWGGFLRSDGSPRRIHAVFRFHDRAGALPRLRRWQSFISDRVLMLTDGKRYLLTGYLYDHPWQFDCRALPDWDAGFVHYYVFEPLVLDVLKKLGVLVWHCAAVERRGRAILLPGASGSGKSTTVLNLLNDGYRFIADDVAVLRKRNGGLDVSGCESALYLTRESLARLPEWKPFVRGHHCKKGRQWKSRLDLATWRSGPDTRARVTMLLFPRIARNGRTSTDRLTDRDTLLECLRQAPKEFPATTLGPSALQKQFEIYSTMVSSAAGYRVWLGSDQTEVRAVLSALVRRS